LYPAPAQVATLTAQRDASIAALASFERAQSIAAGVTWGQNRCGRHLAWRLTDGIAPAPPPFLGVQSIVGTPAAIGAWRPTPQGLPNQLPGVSGAGPQFATMTPWVLRRPSQFRLPPPPALDSPEYTGDLDELFKMGVYAGSGERRINRTWHCFGRATLHFTGTALPPNSLWNAGCHFTRMHTCSRC